LREGEAEPLAMMEQADRDEASGHTMPLAEVLAEMDEVIRKIETDRHARPA
jgi:hypothetical protein